MQNVEEKSKIDVDAMCRMCHHDLDADKSVAIFGEEESSVLPIYVQIKMFAGIEVGMRIFTIHRDQWINVFVLYRFLRTKLGIVDGSDAEEFVCEVSSSFGKVESGSQQMQEPRGENAKASSYHQCRSRYAALVCGQSMKLDIYDFVF